MDVIKGMSRTRSCRESLAATGLAVLLTAGAVTGAAAQPGETPDLQRLLHEHVLRENGQLRLRPGGSTAVLLRLSHRHTLRENGYRGTPSAPDLHRMLYEHVLRENDRD